MSTIHIISSISSIMYYIYIKVKQRTVTEIYYNDNVIVVFVPNICIVYDVWLCICVSTRMMTGRIGKPKLWYYAKKDMRVPSFRMHASLWHHDHDTQTYLICKIDKRPIHNLCSVDSVRITDTFHWHFMLCHEIGEPLNSSDMHIYSMHCRLDLVH